MSREGPCADHSNGHECEKDLTSAGGLSGPHPETHPAEDATPVSYTHLTSAFVPPD